MTSVRAGVDLGATKIQAVVVGEGNAVLGEAKTETPTTGGPPAVTSQIEGAVREAAEAAGVAVSELRGAGVGSPGAVDRDAGTVAHARNLPDWDDPFPLAARLADALGTTVRIENDVKVAVTEACTNVLKHARSVLEEYEVELTIDRDRVSIRIKDAGGGFDHAAVARIFDDAQARQLDATEESGRGIILMRALVDELEFSSEPEAGTVVHLTKTVVLTKDSPLTRFDRLEAPRV